MSPQPNICPNCSRNLVDCNCPDRGEYRAIFILCVPDRYENMTLDQIRHDIWKGADDILEEIALTCHRYFFDQPADREVVQKIILTLRRRL